MELSPYDPKRMLRYIDDVPAMKTPDPGAVKPRMLLLYPSMTCNQHCGYCYYLPMHQPKSFMELATMKRVFYESLQLGVEGVELCGGGEALLHPDVMEFLEYGLFEMRLKFGVLTHGSVNRPDLFKLIGEQFSYIRFSVDYADPEKYARTRGTTEHAYQLMTDNVRRVLDARNNVGGRCKVSLKATVWEQGPQDVVNLIQLGMRLGVDSVQFKRADEIGGGLDDDRERRGEIVNIIEMYRNLAEQDPAMPRLIYNFGREKLRHRCWITPIHVFVETSGDVFLCCYYTNRRETHIIGNVNEASLLDIWGGERHIEAIKGTDPDHCNKYACRFVGYMTLLDRVTEDDEAQVQFV